MSVIIRCWVGAISAVSLGLFVGCGVETAGDAGRPVDATPPLECAASPPLEMGRCVDEAGLPCAGTETQGAFAPLPDDGSLAPIIGPQSSTMFAFAVRATDVSPGDPDQPFSTSNPVIELLLVDDASVEVARYRGRNGMRPVTELAGVFEAAQLYLVVDQPAATLFGNAYVVHATLTDAAGAVRCGQLEFAAPPR